LDNAVHALVGRTSEALASALAEQHRAPDAVIDESARLDHAAGRAVDAGATWIWLLDGTVAPRPAALATLLEALDRMDGIPAPAVLCGVVLDGDGRVDESRAASYRPSEIDVALTAAGRRLLPIRAVAGPVLLHRDAVDDLGGAADRWPSPAAVLELTAAVLRTRTGYVVPASEGDALLPVPDPLGDPATAARLVTARELRPVERLRFGYEFALRAGARVSARRRAARPAAPPRGS
jgi:hypothetical protein